MAAQLFVLFLALVMEDEDFRSASFADDLADNASVRLGADLPLFTGNCDDREFDLAIGAGSDFLHSNHIPGRHPVLLSTSADHRVHNVCLRQMWLESARGTNLKRNLQCESPGAHTSAAAGPADFLCLLCFPPRRFKSLGRRPQNGSASTVKLDYFIVRGGNRSMRSIVGAGGLPLSPTNQQPSQGA